MTLSVIATAGGVATACLGAYVAYLAYDGHRRNESRTMLLLAVGVVCIAVVPYGISYVLTPLLSLSDAVTVLGVTVAHLAGLGALARSVTA
ncbi:hypothetical protein SAMN04488066_106149 [Halorubrum aquaticum]|uniref:Uncharacterized protein n=2 Tax=Halorubrum TaxID=56688 RepID=A0A1I3AMI3_9EURY|nr:MULTISPECIES: hypothetical protein [Halorubrum]OYR78671.1 hypothetical protein DJ84_20840 [Halorubrum ezzemoulense]SFH51264.1 hypothetical protein SAMN04488066_106149 [Halorubrum aquaticum]